MTRRKHRTQPVKQRAPHDADTGISKADVQTLPDKTTADAVNHPHVKWSKDDAQEYHLTMDDYRIADNTGRARMFATAMRYVREQKTKGNIVHALRVTISSGAIGAWVIRALVFAIMCCVVILEAVLAVMGSSNLALSLMNEVNVNVDGLNTAGKMIWCIIPLVVLAAVIVAIDIMLIRFSVTWLNKKGYELFCVQRVRAVALMMINDEKRDEDAEIKRMHMTLKSNDDSQHSLKNDDTEERDDVVIAKPDDVVIAEPRRFFTRRRAKKNDDASTSSSIASHDDDAKLDVDEGTTKSDASMNDGELDAKKEIDSDVADDSSK